MNKIKNQTKQKETHRYRETDSCQRRRVVGLGKKSEGIKQTNKQTNPKPHTDGDKSTVITKGKGIGAARKG